MSSRGQTQPATKTRLVLQPLKTQKPKGSTPEKQSPEMEKRKRTDEEEKDTKQETRPVSDTIRPIPDIRVQAGDIEGKVLVFCLDPSKRINTEQTATIMRYLKDVRGILEKLLIHNSYLTGKL